MTVAQETTNLKQFHDAVLALNAINYNIGSYCSRIREWLPNYGYPRMNPKEDTSDLYPTVLAYEVASVCSDDGLKNTLLAFLVKRVAKIDLDHAVILDKKNSFKYTSMLLGEALSAKSQGRPVSSVTNSMISGFISTVVDFAGNTDFNELKEIIKANQQLPELGLAIPHLVESKLKKSGDSYSLKWAFTDLFGKTLDFTKPIKVRVDGEVVPTTSSHFTTFKSDKREVEVELEQDLYTLKTRVFLATELNISDISIAVTKGNERVKEYQHREGDSISCTQESKIHIKFSTGSNFDPEYAAVYLKNVESQDSDRISAGVPLRIDAQNNKFTASIDLGDITQIYAVSGKYKLSIYIADRSLSENIQRSIADVSIKFNNEVPIASILDSAMPHLDNIDVTYPPSKSYSFLINVFFAAIIGLASLWIFKVQFSQKWNTNLFPKDPTKLIHTYIFWGLFAALYALLLYYWHIERFFDIVIHLFVLMGAAFIFGNFALTNLTRKHGKSHKRVEKKEEASEKTKDE